MNTMMHFFEHERTPDNLKETGEKFRALAEFIEATMPNNAHRNEAMRKLVDSQQAAFTAIMGRN